MSVLALSGRRAVLADAIRLDSNLGALAKNVALVVSGAVLTGLAAQIAVPIPGSPVPVTGQTFAALLVGAVLVAPPSASRLGPRVALVAGVVPFLVGDALKIAHAAGLLPSTWALVRRFQQS